MRDEIVFKVFDKDIWPLPDDAVGWAAVKMSSMCINGGRSFSVDLFFNNDFVGILKLATIYTPMQQMNINFDTNYVERLINELKSNTELLEADRESAQENFNSKVDQLTRAETKLIAKRDSLEKDKELL